MKIGIRLAAAALPALATAGCDALGSALTAHSRPAAEATGVRLTAEELGRVLAVGVLPDTALNGYWAAQFATLWADYVRLARLYTHPDTALALDYDPLLEGQRYYDALAVARYRDSVVLRGIEPTESEVREFFDRRQPFTRLDVRRIRLTIPEEAGAEVRDSLYTEAQAIHGLLVEGADFVEVARARSDEPLAARGQLLRYQGHSDFPGAADSLVYAAGSGEVTPPVSTGEEILVYQVERRIEPEYEEARDRTRRLLIEERAEEVSLRTQDTLIGNSRPSVLDGAVTLARRLAADPAMAEGRIPPGAPLVRYRDGEITARELRLLFQVRADIRDLFAAATDEEIEGYLYELARDEILVTAARRHGMGVQEEERRALARAASTQVAAIARQLGLSHNLVTAPAYDIQEESLAFLERSARRGKQMPWLGELRFLFERPYPARVDRRGADLAARIAAELREEGQVEPAGGEPATAARETEPGASAPETGPAADGER